MPSTTIVISNTTRERLGSLQGAMRAESEGHVSFDDVVTRLLDRSDYLTRLLAANPEICHDQ